MKKLDKILLLAACVTLIGGTLIIPYAMLICMVCAMGVTVVFWAGVTIVTCDWSTDNMNIGQYCLYCFLMFGMLLYMVMWR